MQARYPKPVCAATCAGSGDHNRQHPAADTIHLVMDNLNIHGPKTLLDYFGNEKGVELWNRFTFHKTPKHSNWLNQAEIEISLFARQCFGRRRIPTLGETTARSGRVEYPREPRSRQNQRAVHPQEGSSESQLQALKNKPFQAVKDLAHSEQRFGA
jgi:hypothetical protein